MRLFRFVLCAAALAGCADPHLGDGYGRRVRSALDAQTQGRGEVSRAIDGTDAKLVLGRHRDTGAPPGSDQKQNTAGAILVPTITSGSSSSSSTREMPAAGSIRLDAVR